MSAMRQAIVLYDGECPMCCKTTSILKRLDWRRRLSFHNCRDTNGIPANTAHLNASRMIAEMHVLASDRKSALSGFRAVRWIAGRIPLMWPIYSLLFIPGMAKLGQRIYLWIARKRFNLVPCRDGICTIRK